MGLAFRCPGDGPCLGTDSGSQMESGGKFREAGRPWVGDSERRGYGRSASVLWGHQSPRPGDGPTASSSTALAGSQTSRASLHPPLWRRKDRWARPGRCGDKNTRDLWGNEGRQREAGHSPPIPGRNLQEGPWNIRALHWDAWGNGLNN